MKRFGRLMVLALMIVGLMLPGLAGTASAQDASWCAEAEGLAAGTDLYGYTVVYGSGGAGSQIVLGYGGGTLSGGSGNDVLCAWGGGNTLDGGSGNDILIVMSGFGNGLYGGSGNDTLIGFEYDYFDGGSGRNSITEQPVAMSVWWPMDVLDGNGMPLVVVVGSGFVPNSSIVVGVDEHFADGYQWRSFESTVVVDFDGTFSMLYVIITYSSWCAYQSYFNEELYYTVSVVDSATSSLLYTSEQFDIDCS